MRDLDGIAAEIHAARRDRSPFRVYPALDIAAGFDVQDRVTARSGPVGGYKIAWNSAKLMADYRMPHPGAARILAADIHEDGAVLDRTAYRELLMEPEIAVILGQPVTPDHPWDCADDLRERVARFVPAIELLDRRGAQELHAPSILAGNVFNCAIVLGGPGAGPDADLTSHCTVTCAGRVLCDAPDTAPQPVLEAMAFLVRHYTSRGVTLHAGQVLMCGTHAGITPLAPGDEVTMTVTGLGSVSLCVAEG